MEKEAGEEVLAPSERIRRMLRPRTSASAAPLPSRAPANENPPSSSANGLSANPPATQATGIAQPTALVSDPIPSLVTRPLEERYQHMAALRPLRKRIHPRFVPAFLAAAENAAARYLADPHSEDLLLDILALVKVGLRGCGDGKPIAERLKDYPDVPWPEVQEQDRPPAYAAPRTSEIAAKVHKHIVNGSLSQAARTLGSDTGVLPLTDEIKMALAMKHPVGPENPFPGPGPMAPRKLCKDDEWDSHFRRILSTIPADTSGGPSGWSKPLLSLALRGERFREFIKLLSTQLANGTAPGRTTLGAALLIPLAKKDGGVRPIAVCELIYRFCAKVIARCVDTEGSLLPFQFGVGSSGGTEPIIRLGEHFADGTLKTFNCVMATDFSNAYNAADRKGIGEGIREHTGKLYRLASWRLGAETPLLIVQNGKVTVLQSSQGVPQGDPLSPLFFCIGSRKVAAQLQEFLGEDGFVVCYLDDWYIFGKDEEVVKRAVEFLEGLEREGKSGGLRLNKEKCKMVRREDLKEGGFEMLGTMIGSTAARKDFLQAKIAEQEATINKLRNLPKQDALLLLLLCVQHNLRHLLRCLKTDDIQDAWLAHDHTLASTLRSIRSDIPRRGPYDHFLFPLPLRRGGCGLPTFAALAPCARGAMTDFADGALEELFEQGDQIGGADPLPLMEGPRSDERQKDRCRKVWEELEVGLWKKLEEEKAIDRAKTVVGSSSLLSWLWMVSTPYDISTTLPNHALSVGLWNRTLLAAPHTACLDCGEVYIHGHDDTCRPRMHRRTKRHDGIRNLLAAAIRRIKDSMAIIEPRIEERASQHRSDMRVSGPAAPSGGLVEYDLTCISVHSKDARTKHRSREVKEVMEEHGFRAAVEKVVELQMEAAAEKKRKKYADIITLAFQPLVITLDGTLNKETAATFKHWRSLSPSWSSVSAAIACTLLRTRAETYCLW